MSNQRGDHGHTAVEERRNREAALDETIANSFPASDPPSSIPNPDDHTAANVTAPGHGQAIADDSAEAGV